MYRFFTVVTNTREDVAYLTKEIDTFLNTNYYKDNDAVMVETSTIKSQLSEINNVMGNISMAIGIRKALGATNIDISLQFIIESVIICIIGGIIGLLLGGATGYAASVFIKSPTFPSVLAMIVAVSFSMFIGIFFRY